MNLPPDTDRLDRNGLRGWREELDGGCDGRVEDVLCRQTRTKLPGNGGESGCLRRRGLVVQARNDRLHVTVRHHAARAVIAPIFVLASGPVRGAAFRRFLGAAGYELNEIGSRRRSAERERRDQHRDADEQR